MAGRVPIALGGSQGKKSQSKIQLTIKKFMDMKWHCYFCDIPENRKTIILNMTYKHNIRFEKSPDGSHNYIMMFCPICGKDTPHRKIAENFSKDPDSVDIDGVQKMMGRYPELFKKYEDLIKQENHLTQNAHATVEKPKQKFTEFRRELDGYTLDPVCGSDIIRVPKDAFRHIPEEKENSKELFFFLSKEHAELKTKVCIKCQETKKRQASLDGIKYFWYGNERYEGFCKGCFWGTPNEWRDVVKMRLGIS